MDLWRNYLIFNFIKYRGTGTYEIKGEILSSLLGNVNTISKLVTVTPFRSPYKPEIGHVIIGRVISVNKKSWDVDIFAQRYGTLNLTAINLPRGEQRIRNEDDQMQMRLFFKENDLLSGEIQQIHINGQIHIQTRNLKYGKLKNGILLKVNHTLVKKTKHQFIDLVDDIKAILGLNGIIWIYFSTVKVADEYFNDDKTQIESLNKDEKPDFYSSILIILFRNIIKSLDENEIMIIKENILRYYNLYMEHFHKDIKKDDINNFKKIPLINEEQEKIIIDLIKEELNKEKIKKEKTRKEKEKNKEKKINNMKNKRDNDKFEIDDDELEEN
jgi:exosome complex component RRP4